MFLPLQSFVLKFLSVVPELDISIMLARVVFIAPRAFLVKEKNFLLEADVGDHDIRVDIDHVHWAVARYGIVILVFHLLHHFEELCDARPVEGAAALDRHRVLHDEAANLAEDVLRFDQLFLPRQRLPVEDALDFEVELIGIDALWFRNLARDVKFVKRGLLRLQRCHELEGDLFIDLKVLEVANFARPHILRFDALLRPRISLLFSKIECPLKLRYAIVDLIQRPWPGFIGFDERLAVLLHTFYIRLSIERLGRVILYYRLIHLVMAIE